MLYLGVGMSKKVPSQSLACIEYRAIVSASLDQCLLQAWIADVALDVVRLCGQAGLRPPSGE